MDFLVLPTLTLRVLFVFIVLHHERRRIVRFGVTAHPTATWVKQQITEAFPWDTAPRYLIHDRDSAYGTIVSARIEHLFILDQNRNVAYKGSFDDKMSEPSKHFAVDAVEAILAGKKPETASTKEFGCGIQLSIK